MVLRWPGAEVRKKHFDYVIIYGILMISLEEEEKKKEGFSRQNGWFFV